MKLYFGLLTMLTFMMLSACASSAELDAVRQIRTPVWAPDDKPRIEIVSLVTHDKVKDSFRYELTQFEFCHMAKPIVVQNPEKKPDSTAISTSDGKLTVTINLQSSRSDTESSPAPKAADAQCVKEIALYAFDQCDSLSNTQKDAFGTTTVLVGIATAGASLATDALAISNPSSGNKTADAALAAAVTSNAGNFPKIVPQPVAFKVTDFVTTATTYADGLGIKPASFNCSIAASCDDRPGELTESMIFKLARVHDAAMSVCPAIAYHRLSKPKSLNRTLKS